MFNSLPLLPATPHLSPLGRGRPGFRDGRGDCIPYRVGIRNPIALVSRKSPKSLLNLPTATGRMAGMAIPRSVSLCSRIVAVIAVAFVVGCGSPTKSTPAIIRFDTEQYSFEVESGGRANRPWVPKTLTAILRAG